MDLLTISAVITAAGAGTKAMLALDEAGRVGGEDRLRIHARLGREVGKAPDQIDWSQVRAAFVALYPHIQSWTTEDLIWLKKELLDCESILPDLLPASTLWALDRESRELRRRTLGGFWWAMLTFGLFVAAAILFAATVAAVIGGPSTPAEWLGVFIFRTTLFAMLSAFLFGQVFRRLRVWRLAEPFKRSLKSRFEASL